LSDPFDGSTTLTIDTQAKSKCRQNTLRVILSAQGERRMSKIFVISGPSGSGKTTLVARLLKERALKRRLVKSVSLTTRPKRSGEREGRDYFFLTPEEFSRRLKAKKILEWTRYLGYDYATLKDFVEAQLAKGKHLVLCLDLRGAERIQELYPKNTVLIFVAPPSLEALWERIKKRCRKTKREEIKKRLRLARREVLAAARYDYCLVNADLRETLERLKQIIRKETAR